MHITTQFLTGSAHHPRGGHKKTRHPQKDDVFYLAHTHEIHIVVEVINIR